MRVTQNLSNRNFLYNVENLNTALQDASQQVSTGKKINHLKDSPSGSAELVELREKLDQIDQYRTNSDTGTSLVGLNDSILTSVHDLVTTIFTRGSEAASNYRDSNSQTTLIQEVRALRDQILSLANTESHGRYVFSGSKVTAPAFTITGDTATYQGDSVVNKVQIGDSLDVQVNLEGDSVFQPVFDNIKNLLTALDANNQAGVQQALGQFSTTLGGLNRFRGQVGLDLSRLQNLGIELNSQATSIKTRQGHVEDTNMPEAITHLTQVQTAVQAALSAQSSTTKRTLFDFLA